LSFHDRDRVDAGSKAPDFTSLSQSEEMVNLREFLGNKSVVMVFQQYKEHIP
jgi:peroxiredoxin